MRIEKCFGLNKPNVSFSGVFPDKVLQGEPFVLAKGLDYEEDIKVFQIFNQNPD